MQKAEISAAPQRIAVVLQNASTGGWRYTCRLLEGMRQVDPQLSITAYLGRRLRKVCERESPGQVIGRMGIDVRSLPWIKPINQRSRWKRVVGKLRQGASCLSYRRWVADLDAHDLVFFAWPFGIECPPCTKPMVFVPHDFNYTHFMGSFVESVSASRAGRAQHARWLARAWPVVSSQFIADELKRTFPHYTSPVRVIPLSQLGSQQEMRRSEADAMVAAMGVQGDYLLCLNNISAHKNLGQVLSGYYYARQRHPQLKLIIAGFGTEGIRGNANSPFYIDQVERGGDVISLGLRRDREITALIQRAKLVINGSLYEAGNGSGLDAWSIGTPVAMSAIEPFLEQQQQLGVAAETFNPRCCYEIRDAILRILDDPERAQRNAQLSKQAMRQYRWTHVATRYLEYFKELHSGQTTGGSRTPENAPVFRRAG